MKKNILLSLFLTGASLSPCLAQEKTERYCEVISYPGLLKNEKIKVDFGEKSAFSAFRDTAMVSRLLKVQESKSPVDILNYMGSLGWELVNVVPNLDEHSTTNGYAFFFKKSFDAMEILAK
jgi:hypothetical protein